MATNGTFGSQEQYKSTTEQYPATSGPADATSGNASGNDLSKDEVGWYFVEQYYTTLSKSPEKLHLFYGKLSQFVSGLEAEVAPVSVGRNAIQERIKDLDFQDCKVRVSNVDSQGSYDNIVIQVIGETSNKSSELKKFVQTFVLAQQPTGYFVLNDIFRYINEEGEEEPVENTQEESAAGPLVEDVEMPKAQAASEEAAAPLDAEVVDKKLEEVAEPEPVAEIAPTTNGAPAPEVEETPAPASKVDPTPAAAEKAVEEEVNEPEKPKAPVPSPAITRAPSTTKPAAPAQPTGPPKPLSWASRAAAAVGSAPKPAVPVIAPKASTPPTQARQAPASAKPAQAPAPTPAPAPATETDNENGAGWQSVGNDHQKKQNRPQSISGPPEKEGTMGYVRNVTEKVSTEDLRTALSGFGNLIYFDVNRAKNCAFVEYSAPEGYQAAAAANPHQVSGEAIYVEARRPKPSAYGGNGYGGARGGLNQRGRGQFQNRGRGGGGPPRAGRGTSRPSMPC
ncbi:related to Ras-GTPase-activating protein binding protein 2 [Rhynchosporium secalis]|uniref:Related to Ras-GTPase-activating protein binding protein 2 n=1 Tax=Rhynchosporium secalis TaxID=38038 RepID=A0A1E1MQG9_RHYSE|nr:related to Ras-GTPase-activating protein binding protein 2 [Rhynchosporium secalis]